MAGTKDIFYQDLRFLQMFCISLGGFPSIQYTSQFMSSLREIFHLNYFLPTVATTLDFASILRV